MKFKEHYGLMEVDINNEMTDFFHERTLRHINLTKKYAQKLSELNIKGLKDIVNIVDKHDQSKFEEPEYIPYIYLTWRYKCKDDGVNFKCPEGMEDEITKATNHHVNVNAHHPEHYDNREELINPKYRDEPRENFKMVDATQMPDISIAEMCCDWCAMSEERGNSPQDWADRNVNIRWKFTDEQKDLIYEILDNIWDE